MNGHFQMDPKILGPNPDPTRNENDCNLDFGVHATEPTQPNLE